MGSWTDGDRMEEDSKADDLVAPVVAPARSGTCIRSFLQGTQTPKLKNRGALFTAPYKMRIPLVYIPYF